MLKLVACELCKKEISDEARACPTCGHPRGRPRIDDCGFILPCVDRIVRTVSCASFLRVPKTKARSDIATLAAFFVAAVLPCCVGWSDGVDIVLSVAVAYGLVAILTRSFEAAILEPWRSPNERRTSHSRSFLHVWIAYLTVMFLFSAAYRLRGCQLLDAYEAGISFGTNLGNNNPFNDRWVRIIRLCESIVGTFYLAIIIGRFAGAFTKEEGGVSPPASVGTIDQ